MSFSKPIKAHIAVATLFVANGMMFGNVLPRIPAFKNKLDLTEGELGMALLCIAFGSISMFFFAPAIIRRLTSSFAGTYAGIVLVVSVIPLALMWNLGSLMLGLLLVGWANGLMDISMNMQVVEVERLRKKPLMSHMHALWSVGSLLGGAMSGFVIFMDIGLFPHFLFVGVFCALAIFLTRSWIVATEVQRSEGGWVFPSKYLVILGVIGLCAAMSEAASMEWSALYLASMLPSDSVWTVSGFVAFTSAMVIGRLTGDKVIATFSAVPMLLSCSALVVLGYGFMLSVNTAWAAVIGYALAGFGISLVAPLIYGIGARDTTRPPGVGLAFVTAVGYGGFLVGAPLIGFIAEASSLRFALTLIVLLMVLLILLTTQIRTK